MPDKNAKSKRFRLIKMKLQALFKKIIIMKLRAIYTLIIHPHIYRIIVIITIHIFTNIA